MILTVQKVTKLMHVVKEAIYSASIPVGPFKYYAGEAGRAAAAPGFDDRDWQDFSIGDSWGGYDQVAWFRTRVQVPEEMAGSKLALRFLVGPRDGGGSTAESLLYVNGRPLQGLDYWHEDAVLPPDLLQGDLDVAIRAWSGVMRVPPKRTFREARLVQINEPCERFYFATLAALRSTEELDENDLRRTRLLELLHQAYVSVDFSRPGSPAFYDMVLSAESCLTGGLRQYAQQDAVRPTVVGLGNSHIDMAWLWRLCHTREKASRTFSTVLNLMRQYPEYRYLHTSPQLFKYLKADYPDIYEQIRERVAEGSFELTGGMWVEADTNLTGGESLVRQILLGKQFVREEFGRDMHVLWLPDVFGYSAALPQIAVKSGLKYFVTSKISWNQFNRFPYDTFYWRGLDGTDLLTHFITTPEENSHHYTYIGEFQPREVVGAWKNYQQKEMNDQVMMLFGWGDGGGGPTRAMLESARVLSGLPGVPKVEIDTAEHFLAQLERRLFGKDVPVWDGELYLEYHRGTYTSQAQVKRANRQAEVLYHDAEWLSSFAHHALANFAYPKEQLREGWEHLLCLQFHDVLPGSSIHAVYEDAARDYTLIQQLGCTAREWAMQALTANIAADGPALAVFNGLGWRRDDVLALDETAELHGKTVLINGSPAPAQTVDLLGEPKRLFAVAGVPPLGYGTYSLVEAPQPEETFAGTQCNPRCLENQYYRIEFNEKGQITSLFDKTARREWIAPGEAGNVLQAFEDRPVNFDAWDIDIYYQDKMALVEDLVEARIAADGPVVTVLRLAWRFRESHITQEIWLHHHLARIDFHTEVDWHEHQTLLKAAFSLKVRAREAAYEVQFGVVERPTHRNTSWDMARFEVPAHKWADLSEGNGGVALLNDCKYGYDALDHTLRLTLIKSGVDPDPQADQGLHRFTYSLLPHMGGWQLGGVQRAGYELNNPLLAWPVWAAQPGALPPHQSLVECQPENVIIETVKQAEDGDSLVVRVYESRQYTVDDCVLTFALPVARAVECDLMEENDQPVHWEGNQLTFGVCPFEIKTFKVWFEK